MTTSIQLYPIYTVNADRETGEWIGEAQPTGDVGSIAAFLSITPDDTHRDTYEVDGETCLILITWVD